MIDADDLEMLTASFEASGATDADFHELGWADLLEMAPLQGAAAAFAVLGRTGSTAGLLDDVVAHALGLAVGGDVCVALPAPHSAAPAGVRKGDHVVIDGLVSTRATAMSTVIVPVEGAGVARVALSELEVGGTALDPGAAYRRLRGSAPATTEQVGDWGVAITLARVALAHHLVAASRVMLELARQHAVDRIQFGKPIASFQAVRHKLSESLVAIEGAAAVADACVGEACDPLLAASAKSLAGKAARTTATHAQQVLAGIGFTTDHAFHLALKRTLVLDTLFGSARTIPAEIGTALLAQNGAPRLIGL
jgi:hypothetical protein